MRDRSEYACPTCGGDHEAPQWAIVAVSGHSRSAVVLCSSPAVACDLREGMLEADDVWTFEPEDSGSILRWDGRIVYDRSVWEPGDFDVSYKGEFRPVTVEDLSMLGLDA